MDAQPELSGLVSTYVGPVCGEVQVPIRISHVSPRSVLNDSDGGWGVDRPTTEALLGRDCVRKVHTHSVSPIVATLSYGPQSAGRWQAVDELGDLVEHVQELAGGQLVGAPCYREAGDE